MDETTFWTLVEHDADRVPDDRLDRLTTRLAGLPPPDVADFQVLLDHVRGRADTWDHWAAAHLVLGGCSDDGFFYFLAWLVGLGRTRFARVAEDPDALADHPAVQHLATLAPGVPSSDDPDWEALDYVAREAYRRTTGDPDGLDTALAARGHEPMVAPDPDGAPWDFDDTAELLRRLPRLTALFADRDAQA
ncbi:DUF4240 domain-containing protein [Umezawaea sp. Da 62-37]|uniref:DUF4240 domain-containing protein n=1 Tax=Umezawaea sp. Da 62-37 TaxID=3075927 RepID=UPI0028F73A13|nr:DUF4240 domain-containing protein [Umezawaea sp. Da 62-37]WNV86511.1 DUF4240 domain-containing protein [Umezawaea sp. Da 62-37]